MMKRKLKSYVLLVICMLMLVAQVLPHHHHSEIFCRPIWFRTVARKHAAETCIIAMMPTAIRAVVLV